MKVLFRLATSRFSMPPVDFVRCTLGRGEDGDPAAFLAKMPKKDRGSDMCELPELTKPAILENLKERFDGECRAGRDRVGLCACINYVYGNGSLLTGSGTQRSSASIEPSAAGSGAWLAPAVVKSERAWHSRNGFASAPPLKAVGPHIVQ